MGSTKALSLVVLMMVIVNARTCKAAHHGHHHHHQAQAQDLAQPQPQPQSEPQPQMQSQSETQPQPEPEPQPKPKPQENPGGAPIMFDPDIVRQFAEKYPEITTEVRDEGLKVVKSFDEAKQNYEGGRTDEAAAKAREGGAQAGQAISGVLHKVMEQIGGPQPQGRPNHNEPHPMPPQPVPGGPNH